MAWYPKETEKKAGLAPGTLAQIGEQKVETATITIMEYGETTLHEEVVESPSHCQPFVDTSKVTWIDVEGIHDFDMLREFGEMFNLHPLVLEDIVNTNQRPKIDDHGDYIFVVMKLLFLDEETERLATEQISLVLGRNFVLTFQEIKRGILNPLRMRIRDSKGRIRRRRVDYLFYALIDVIIDDYFIVLEKLGNELEALEEEVILDPNPDVLKRIFNAKVNALVLRRAIWPLRDLTNVLVRGESSLLGEDIEHFLHDLHDHTVQLLETVGIIREMVTSMSDLYLSVANNRMNEVMKVLTMMATIFIPLTFIAGIYGMNFKLMPELEWRWGYFAVLGFMVAVGVAMVAYFKRKKWL